jgi:VWFA-related protein
MRLATRFAAPVVAALLAAPATSTYAAPRQEQEGRPAPIRVAVDVVPVDVQVIDRAGKPVPDLGPDSFTVTINGRRRRVLSAEQIRSDTPEHRSGVVPATANAAPGRVILIAVDCISFDQTASRDVIQSVGQFVRGLNADDHVGLSAYPNGAHIAPTLDHAQVLRALDTIVGQRDGAGTTLFNIRPTEIVDIARDLQAGGGSTLDTIVARECGREFDPNCRYQLLTEVQNTALYYEGQGSASLGMLLTIVSQLQSLPGRKALILVSGGMIASDVPGGRPNLGSIGTHVGRAAAGANTTIYTLFVDTTVHDRYAAETRRGQRTQDHRGRESAVLSRWLEQFAGAAGGALFNIAAGNAVPALERIQSELSSYYLLGVEPNDEDRDGRTHEVAVKLTRSNLTIRGRRWVTIPKRAAGAPAIAAADGESPGPSPALPPADVAPARVAPAVKALADAFDRDGNEGFQRALARADLTSVLRDFRVSESPWPGERRRTAVFALELALAGLRSGTRDARDEAGRLLAEYHVRVREPGGADEFECWWFVTEASALQGLFMPESALLFIPRALQRCPSSARLHLAHAFALEQQWLRGRTVAAQEPEIVARYEGAMKFPETAAEARVRAARFLSARGEHARALQMLEALDTPPPDPEVRYYTIIVRGQALRALGRADDAAAAFREALQTWPGAQSARVALMTLLMSGGNRGEAAALAEEIQNAAADQYDPWWTFWLGDYRRYPAVLERLRELAR